MRINRITIDRNPVIPGFSLFMICIRTIFKPLLHKCIFLAIFIFFMGIAFVHAETSPDENAYADITSFDEARIRRGLEYITAHKPKNLIPLLKNILLEKGQNELHAHVITALKSYPLYENILLWTDILNESPSFFVKIEAINLLASLNRREIITPIMKQLKSPFSSVREASIQALKKFRDDRVYAYVLNLAASDNPLFRVYALNTVYHIYDSRLYNFLVDQLKDENKSIRYQALLCLEKNEPVKSINHISNLAVHDKNSEVRVKAIEILAKVAYFNPLPIFLRCLDDEHRDIRYASVQSIGKRKFKQTSFSLSNRLYVEKEDDIKRIIMSTLADFKDGGGYKGLGKIIKTDENPHLRIHAAYCIGEIGQLNGLPLLIDAVKDSDYRVRAEALSALSHYKELRSAEVLLASITSDDDIYVRSAALYALKKIKLKNTLLPLFQAYTEEHNSIFKELLRVSIAELITHFTR